MKKRLLLLTTILLTLLLASTAAAQSADPVVVAQAHVDRVQMRVGDLLSYELSVVAPEGMSVVLPAQPSESFGEWEVRSCSALAEQQPASGSRRQGWSCVLTIWTVGEHELPSQEAAYSGTGTSGSARTEALTVTVVSVLEEDASEIKPLKPQLAMEDPANLLLIIGLIILALLVAGAMALAIMYYRRSQPAPAPALVAPMLDPAMAALRELERIARLGLLEQGRVVEYCVLIADTLRTYVVQRYRIPALERTTRELQSAMSSAIARAQHDQLVSLLMEADGVKFARFIPAPEWAEAMLDRARRAIEISR